MPHNNLKVLRNQKNVTIRQLAEAIGVSFQMIWGYEHGKKKMSLSRAAQIAGFLGCTIEDLIKE